MKRVLLVSSVLLASILGCGSAAEDPHVALTNEPPNDPASTSTAVILATRDGASTVVRVDAKNDSMAPLTPPLPAGFHVQSFEASRNRDRFIVSGGETNGRSLVYAGTREEWHVLAVLEHGWRVTHTSPSLDLVAIEGTGTVGRPIGARIVRFDGSVVEELGVSLDPVLVDDGGFVAVEYELEPAGDGGSVRVGTETQPWWVFDGKGQRIRLADDRGPYDPAFAIDGGFAVEKDGTCSAFAWSKPAPTTSFACKDFDPPLVFDGTNAYHARVDGRDLVAKLPSADGAAIAELDPDGVSVLVSLRESDQTQVVTFTSAGGARVTYEPAEENGRDMSASWTRASSHAGFACAIASRDHCEKGWSGICKQNVVDVVCSDAITQRSKRFERAYDDDGRLVRGAEQFIVTDDARYVVWVDGGILHRLDARTFEETVLDSDSTFGPREGDAPNVFNRSK